MKRSNMMTLLTLALLVAILGFGARFWTANEQSAGNGSKAAAAEGTAESTDSLKLPGAESNQTVTMEDALFIGDSRTVGISEYAGIEDADFYANVGMSVYNVGDKPVSVPTVGKVTLDELLSKKQYGKIYIMLGINEIGYDFDQTISKYKSLVDHIEEKQPGARIFVQANLHVTKRRSVSDSIVNNEAINRFNTAVSEIADGKKIFYMDVNSVFDDSEGNLSEEKSGDNAHLFAKYYIEWGDWIVGQTASLMEEENEY